MKGLFITVVVSIFVIAILVGFSKTYESRKDRAENGLPDGCHIGNPITYDRDRGVVYEIVCNP